MYYTLIFKSVFVTERNTLRGRGMFRFCPLSLSCVQTPITVRVQYPQTGVRGFLFPSFLNILSSTPHLSVQNCPLPHYLRLTSKLPPVFKIGVTFLTVKPKYPLLKGGGGRPGMACWPRVNTASRSAEKQVGCWHRPFPEQPGGGSSLTAAFWELLTSTCIPPLPPVLPPGLCLPTSRPGDPNFCSESGKGKKAKVLQAAIP